MFAPSGDHAGIPPKLRMGLAFVPSAFMTEIPPPPWKTILVPSGENFGFTPDTANCVFLLVVRSKTLIFPFDHAIFPVSELVETLPTPMVFIVSTTKINNNALLLFMLASDDSGHVCCT